MDYLLYKAAVSLRVWVCLSICLYPSFLHDRDQIWGNFRGLKIQKSGKYHELQRKSIKKNVSPTPSEGGREPERSLGNQLVIYNTMSSIERPPILCVLGIQLYLQYLIFFNYEHTVHNIGSKPGSKGMYTDPKGIHDFIW